MNEKLTLTIEGAGALSMLEPLLESLRAERQHFTVTFDKALADAEQIITQEYGRLTITGN